MFSTTIAVIAVLTASVSAAQDSRTFAVNHFYGQGVLVEASMDPIISPGTKSAHVHSIQGGNAFAVTLGDDTLRSSTCTSSLIKNDLSAYWTPKLYFQDPANGSFVDVPVFYMNVYYFFEATDDDIVAFQPGHRMVVGNPATRTPPATGGESITDANDGVPQPIQWTCPRSNYDIPSYPANSNGLDGVGIQDPNNQGAGVGFPDMNCDGYASPLRADIHFPSCYNPAAGLDDYENNMVWPSSAGTTDGKQNCPEGYIHTPHLFYEVYWNTPLYVDMWTQGQGNQPFVLSCGDPTGYGLHADFISGWDVPTLQQIIDNCDAGDSGMDQCPGLIGGVNDPSDSCNIVDPIQETIYGWMDALPGNNPLTGWGHGAGNSTAPQVSSSAVSPSASAYSSAGSASASAGSPSAYPSAGAPPASPSAGAPPASPSAESPPASGYGPSPVGPTTLSSLVPVSVGSAAASSATSGSPINQAPSAAPSAASSPVSAYASGPIPSLSFGSGSCITVTTYTTTDVWATITITATGPSPTGSSPPVESGWSSLGCYSDNISSRVLSGITFADLGIGQVTTTGCVSYCDSNGYTIAGTEYGGQCFCDDSLASSSQQLAASSCDMPCEGDASQICGGGLALSVYEKSGNMTRRDWGRHLRRHVQELREF